MFIYICIYTFFFLFFSRIESQVHVKLTGYRKKNVLQYVGSQLSIISISILNDWIVLFHEMR